MWRYHPAVSIVACFQLCQWEYCIGVSQEGDCGGYERLGITIMQFSRGPPLLFYPDDRVFMFLRNIGGIFRTTRRYSPENRILLRMFSAIQTLG
jgi:hypothetical protein